MSYFSSYADQLRAKLLKKHTLVSRDKAASAKTDSLPSMSSSNTFNGITNVSASETELHSQFFDRKRVNLESHQLVWCDANVNNHSDYGTTITVEKLRKIVDYTKLVDAVGECQSYLENQNDNSTTFLVASGQLGEILIPRIHQLEKVLQIYIYCHNKEYHQQWASKYKKVKELLNFGTRSDSVTVKLS
jgi:hypothetical protein